MFFERLIDISTLPQQEDLCHPPRIAISRANHPNQRCKPVDRAIAHRSGKPGIGRHKIQTSTIWDKTKDKDA
jgi:hypothetical protein